MNKVRKQKRRPTCIVCLKEGRPAKVYALTSLGKLIVDEDDSTGFKTMPCINKSVNVVFPREPEEKEIDSFNLSIIDSTIPLPELDDNLMKPQDNFDLQPLQWNEWNSLDLNSFERCF